jgi:hypothetical protein
MIKKLLPLLLVFLIATTLKSEDIFNVYDTKGKIYTIEEVSVGKDLIIVFFTHYTCIKCNEDLNTVLDSLAKKYEIKVIILSRLKDDFDIVDAYKLKSSIKKYHPNYDVFFDIHNSTDPWPPIKLKGGLFHKYNITMTPAVLIMNNHTKEYLDYKTLFGNDNTNKLLEIIEKGIKK